MAVFWIERFEVRPDARATAERAMHELAAYVRSQLPDVAWTAYRDPGAPGQYVALGRADNRAADERRRTAPGTQAFVAALAPLVVRPIDATEYELVTSSDLAPRRRTR